MFSLTAAAQHHQQAQANWNQAQAQFQAGQLTSSQLLSFTQALFHAKQAHLKAATKSW